MNRVELPSIDETIGNTPLVRLQRIPGKDNERRRNLFLGKLEGNNPGGSVKDRPALSMIVRAEERGEIRRGDRLIEATSGNTGIALAMIAAMKGYRMTLIMPDNLSAERRASMTAYGAELILTPAAKGGMQYARDLAMEMQARGEGRVLDQFANADNPRVHYETTGRKSGATRGRHHALRQCHGHHRHHHGGVTLPQGTQSAGSDRRCAAGRRLGHPESASGRKRTCRDLRRGASRPARTRHAGGCRSHGTPHGERGRNLLRHLCRRRARDCAAHRGRHRERNDGLHRLRSR